MHGVIPDDAKFQLALPDNWNGKLVIFSRGFSGTELTPGAFKTVALEKGNAFAASNEGWNRVTIAKEPEDSYYESRQRLRELTIYAHEMVFNSQISQWGSIATVLRHYAVIAPRIDDIIAMRAADANWDPARTALAPPLTSEQLTALRALYNIPATFKDGFAFNVGRWPGSESQWTSSHEALVGYLRDSMPRFDSSFNPNGGALTDDELRLWEPMRSSKAVKKELQRLDLTGDLKRPIIMMHGSADAIVSPGESEGYRALVERRLGKATAEKVLAVYFIPGMGHGGTEYNNLIGAQLDALERWIDYRESKGTRGGPAPDSLGEFPRRVAAPAAAR